MTREIVTRAGVGATAQIVQRRELLCARLPIDQPSILIVLSGTKTLRWDGGECAIEAGEAAAVAGGQTFDVVNRPGANGRYEAGWLVCDPAMVAGFTGCDATLPGIRGALTLGVIEPEFHAAIDRARTAILAADDLPQAIAVQRMIEVLVWLGLRGGRFDDVRASSVAARVRMLVSASPEEPWTAPSIARALAMSEATLRRRLASEQLTLSRLLIDTRMALALSLLQATDRPVAQIAMDVGYDSPSRFAARFRARFGYPPTAIRDSDTRLGLAETHGRVRVLTR